MSKKSRSIRLALQLREMLKQEGFSEDEADAALDALLEGLERETKARVAYSQRLAFKLARKRLGNDANDDEVASLAEHYYQWIVTVVGNVVSSAMIGGGAALLAEAFRIASNLFPATTHFSPPKERSYRNLFGGQAKEVLSGSYKLYRKARGNLILAEVVNVSAISGRDDGLNAVVFSFPAQADNFDELRGNEAKVVSPRHLMRYEGVVHRFAFRLVATVAADDDVLTFHFPMTYNRLRMVHIGIVSGFSCSRDEGSYAERAILVKTSKNPISEPPNPNLVRCLNSHHPEAKAVAEALTISESTLNDFRLEGILKSPNPFVLNRLAAVFAKQF